MLTDSSIFYAVEGVAGITEESDEDLEADKMRAQLAARPVPAPAANAHNTSAGQGSLQDSNEIQPDVEKDMQSHGAADVCKESVHIRSRPFRTHANCLMCFLLVAESERVFLEVCWLPDKIDCFR